MEGVVCLRPWTPTWRQSKMIRLSGTCYIKILHQASLLEGLSVIRGRIELTKATFSNLPIDYLSIYKIPIKLANSIETNWSNFPLTAARNGYVT